MFKPLIALVGGICCGKYFNIALIHYFPYLIVLSFLILIISQLKIFLNYRKYVFSISYYLLMFTLGIWLISINNPYADGNHFSHRNSVQVIGVIDDEPVYKEKTIRFPLRITAMIDTGNTFKVNGKVMITLLKDSLVDTTLAYGDVILFKNKLTETLPPLNPNEFDYKKYLANKEIWHQCFLTSADFSVIQSDEGNFILAKSLRIRKRLIAKFNHYINDAEAYQIAIALIFGYRSQIDGSILDTFTSTGTIHILSVSGLHVSMVFGLLTFLLVVLDRFKHGKLIRYLIILIAVWGYVILTGMSPPIMRAGIMISFFIISAISGRKQVSLNTLLASAIFILIVAPYYLFDIGFQLSYTALLGILLLHPLLRSFWLPNNKKLSLVIEYCYISIAAQLFTLPLTLYYFGQFPIYFLMANLFMAVPSTIIMYLGIALAIMPIDFLNVILGRLLDFVIGFSVFGLKFITHLPISVYKGIVWNDVQVILLVIVLLFIVVAFNYGNKRALFIMLAVLVLLHISNEINRMTYRNYKGTRIYNVRSGIAIAHVSGQNVTLLSTLDSLRHPTLKFSVLPDLIRYSSESDIVFVRLRNDKRNNYAVKLGKRRFLILENQIDTLPVIGYDFIFWRKNNRNSLQEITDRFKGSTIIIDGSNSDKTVGRLEMEMSYPHSIYVLKNNFAYVWEEE